MEVNLDLNDRCKHRIEEVGQWLESLPEDVAEMEVETSHEAYSTWLTIRPLLNPHDGNWYTPRTQCIVEWR